jgi:hypothetical protein
MRLFAGDGESSSTGAARNGAQVRTRSELAALINEASYIKEEPVDNQQMETGDEDGEVEFVRTMEGLADGGTGDTGDTDYERAEALMDEEEEVSVVDTEEGEEDDEGDEVMREVQQDGGGEEAGQRTAGQDPEAATQGAGEAEDRGVEAEAGGSGNQNGDDGTENIPDPDSPDPEGNSDSDAPVDVVEPEPIRVKHPDSMYKPVQSIRSGSQDPLKLNMRMKYDRNEGGGLLAQGDERLLRNSNLCSMELKRNTSASFNPDSGKCVTCLNSSHSAWRSRNGGPIALSLTDQHFPANIPADESGECIRVLRVEDGSVAELAELADELLRIMPREGLPKGSIILYGSVSQLAVDSAERYASEWVKNRNWLKARLGEVMVVPAIFLSGSGFEDKVAIRGLLDLAAWQDSLQDPELRLLRNTRKGWQDAYLGKKSRGAGWADYRLNLAMPVSLDQGTGTTPCTTGSWGDRPTGLTALTEAGERYWISKIVCELNREVGLGLATTWSVGRTMSAVRRQAESVEFGRIVTVVASYAAATAAALGKRGMRHLALVWPGRTITKDTVEAVRQEAATAHEDGDILLVQWLENNIYFMLNEETGCMELPVRDADDGIFHITGKVTVSKDVQLQMVLSKLEPLLAEDPDQLKVLVYPLVRFLQDCCTKHARTEKTRAEEAARLLKELYHLRRAVKTWLITKKMKNVLLVDPLACLGATNNTAMAMTILKDDIHLKGVHTAKLADKIKELVAGLVRTKKRAADVSAGGDEKRPRLAEPNDGGGQKARAKKGGKPRAQGGRKSGP